MPRNRPIVFAEKSDSHTIMALFKDCTQHMLDNGIGQWHFDYPNQKQVNEGIEQKEVFLWKEDQEVLGTITLNEQQDDQYHGVNWKFLSEKVLVIHRLAVAPSAQGKGVGRGLCLFAEQFARENGYDVIRLDAYAGNPASNYLYKNLQYHFAEGKCWFHNNELPFNCWEKKLD